jgi:hypothetical protein
MGVKGYLSSDAFYFQGSPPPPASPLPAQAQSIQEIRARLLADLKAPGASALRSALATWKRVGIQKTTKGVVGVPFDINSQTWLKSSWIKTLGIAAYMDASNGVQSEAVVCMALLTEYLIDQVQVVALLSNKIFVCVLSHLFFVHTHTGYGGSAHFLWFYSLSAVRLEGPFRGTPVWQPSRHHRAQKRGVPLDFMDSQERQTVRIQLARSLGL